MIYRLLASQALTFKLNNSLFTTSFTTYKLVPPVGTTGNPSWLFYHMITCINGLSFTQLGILEGTLNYRFFIIKNFE